MTQALAHEMEHVSRHIKTIETSKYDVSLSDKSLAK